MKTQRFKRIEAKLTVDRDAELKKAEEEVARRQAAAAASMRATLEWIARGSAKTYLSPEAWQKEAMLRAKLALEVS